MFEIIGVDIKPMRDEDYREHLHMGIETFSDPQRLDTGSWYPFSKHISYLAADLNDAQVFSRPTQTGLRDTNGCGNRMPATFFTRLRLLRWWS